MIKSIVSKDTEKIWNGVFVKKIPIQIQETARRKLRMVHNSKDLNDLRIPPSNRMEKLIGNLEGYNSIRINKQWRIIFKWRSGHSFEVEIIDYH
jgi:proteic killer suppression protein